MHLPDDKYKRNSVYSVSVRFHLFSSDSHVVILEFAGYHHAKGCACLAKRPILKLSGSSVKFVGDWRTLVSPYRVEPRSAVLVEYDRSFQPPLTIMSPADCDYGDFEVVLRYQAEGDSVERSWVFQLMTDGQMRAVPRPRIVPQLNDYDLYGFLEDGKLTKGQYEALMQFDPEDRYRVAYSDNLTRNYLDIPDPLREVLRSLVHQAPLKMLYKQVYGDEIYKTYFDDDS